jgi:hypothetical protein
MISTSSFESKIITTHGSTIVVEVMVILRKFKTTFNSFYNSLFLFFCSKILTSFAMGSREARGSM